MSVGSPGSRDGGRMDGWKDRSGFLEHHGERDRPGDMGWLWKLGFRKDFAKRNLGESCNPGGLCMKEWFWVRPTVFEHKYLCSQARFPFASTARELAAFSC